MSTIDDFRSATLAAQSYGATVAVAYASSPLGDPAIEAGSLSDLAKLEHDNPAKYEDYPPTTVTAEPPAEPRSSWVTNVLVGAAVVAAIGTVAGLGLMLVAGTGSKEKPAVVVPDSSVGSLTPQAPGAKPPSPVAPAPPSVATPPDSLQGPTGPVGSGDAPALSGPAPAPAPAAPAPPPVAPAPVSVPAPPHPGHGKHGDGGKQGGGDSGGGNSGGGNSGGGKQGGGNSDGGKQGGGNSGGGNSGSGQQGGKGQKVGGPHPGQVACLPCQQGQAPGKK
jgi:hypothetical protein